MENPYKHAAAPESAAPATDEERRIADYEVAIGPNREYYLPRFETFDSGGSKAGWNWPAFFVTTPWFLYRKMWVPGILNLVYPFVLMFVLGIASAFLIKPIQAHPAVFGLVLLALLAAPWFVLPIFANALYWRHIRNLIDQLPRALAQAPEKRVARLERNGGTGVGAMIGVCVAVGFFFIFIVGILAAIAIPAYQDYTIRAQITEGLSLAGPIKAGVAEFYASNQRWPEQADIGDAPVQGKYVTSVEVSSGSVLITYGNAAHNNLKGKRLALLPGIDSAGQVRWSCGNASPPVGVTTSDGPHGSDVANKYLPSACREGGAAP